MIYPENFDVVVVGGGHAGAEACLASARMGLKTLLLTHNIETIGQLSCNPSIGGIGKGHLIKEIDALGGAMAHCADLSAINTKILNRSKGPAMYGHHAVLDRQLYKQAMRHTIENQKNLFVFQQSVEDIILEQDKIAAVVTQLGIRFNTKAVVLTAGTFLNGVIHVGLKNHSGGRAGEQPSIGLAQKLKELNLSQGRMKTGTPARIDGRSINFDALEKQVSDGLDTGELPVFSFMGKASEHPEQIPCYVTRTSEKTHDILRAAFDQSPMYTGLIEGRGPRYCPSIEDKIMRFTDKDSHQIILEPEGLNVNEYYPNGISTSLPFETQYHAIRTMPGLENAYLTRPGYAIEYDFYEPTCLKRSLETKSIQGLFMAGQIIGSTGYSEAAAMGLLAGINAGLFARGQADWVPMRHDGYLGVMVDDLTTKGVTEPYRMFTSRAEYRLSLREDNADLRLTEIGHSMGLISSERYEHFCKKKESIQQMTDTLSQSYVVHADAPVEEKVNTLNFIKRPEINLQKLVYDKSVFLKKGTQKHSEIHADSQQVKGTHAEEIPLAFYSINGVLKATLDDKKEVNTSLLKEVLTQIDINVKYAGYIDRQKEEIEKLSRNENTVIPADFDYNAIAHLGPEVKQKLSSIKPSTVGQASRISGVTPASVSVLLIHLKKQRASQAT